MDDSRLKATASFASEATLGHNKGSGLISPSPLSQKPSLPPSYNDSTTLAAQSPAPTDGNTNAEQSRGAKAKALFKKLFKKYWFLLGLAIVISVARAAPDVARKGGYIHAEWSIKWGKYTCDLIVDMIKLTS